ncbi:unnamed protein product [Paramecium pentaurelia]|uniref:Transmembrane protein n=1 Tax=Paramecium pentaurelia TaxID=43138 RepID=A0A8S1YEY4_9CILI|nr:unnamed protein product [Paramecium pentaurelia]
MDQQIAAYSIKIIVKYHYIKVSVGSKFIMMLECSDYKAENVFANQNQNACAKRVLKGVLQARKVMYQINEVFFKIGQKFLMFQKIIVSWIQTRGICIEKECENLPFTQDYECKTYLRMSLIYLCYTNKWNSLCKKVVSCHTAQDFLKIYQQSQDYDNLLDCVRIKRIQQCVLRKIKDVKISQACDAYDFEIGFYLIEYQYFIWHNDNSKQKQCSHAPIDYRLTYCHQYGNCIVQQKDDLKWHLIHVKRYWKNIFTNYNIYRCIQLGASAYYLIALISKYYQNCQKLKNHTIKIIIYAQRQVNFAQEISILQVVLTIFGKILERKSIVDSSNTDLLVEFGKLDQLIIFLNQIKFMIKLFNSKYKEQGINKIQLTNLAVGIISLTIAGFLFVFFLNLPKDEQRKSPYQFISFYQIMIILQILFSKKF